MNSRSADLRLRVTTSLCGRYCDQECPLLRRSSWNANARTVRCRLFGKMRVIVHAHANKNRPWREWAFPVRHDACVRMEQS